MSLLIAVFIIFIIIFWLFNDRIICISNKREKIYAINIVKHFENIKKTNIINYESLNPMLKNLYVNDLNLLYRNITIASYIKTLKINNVYVLNQINSYRFIKPNLNPYQVYLNILHIILNKPSNYICLTKNDFANDTNFINFSILFCNDVYDNIHKYIYNDIKAFIDSKILINFHKQLKIIDSRFFINYNAYLLLRMSLNYIKYTICKFLYKQNKNSNLICYKNINYDLAVYIIENSLEIFERYQTIRYNFLKNTNKKNIKNIYSSDYSLLGNDDSFKNINVIYGLNVGFLVTEIEKRSNEINQYFNFSNINLFGIDFLLNCNEPNFDILLSCILIMIDIKIIVIEKNLSINNILSFAKSSNQNIKDYGYFLLNLIHFYIEIVGENKKLTTLKQILFLSKQKSNKHNKFKKYLIKSNYLVKNEPFSTELFNKVNIFEKVKFIEDDIGINFLCSKYENIQIDKIKYNNLGCSNEELILKEQEKINKKVKKEFNKINKSNFKKNIKK